MSLLHYNSGYDISDFKNLPEVGISDELDELKVDISDDDLIEKTNKWIGLGEKYRADLVKRYDDSKKYYLGEQLDKTERRIQDNRIFMGIETIVPITTSATPHPNVLPAQNTVESIKLARYWGKILEATYDRQMVQKKLERVTRFLLLTNYAVLKYFFDPVKFELCVRVVHPTRLLFDDEQDINDGVSWIGELVTESAEILIEKFPKKEKEITKIVKGKLATEITYHEIWTDEIVIWRYNKIILGKMKNPNFIDDSKDKKKKKDTKASTKNFFERPKKPYVFINLFDIGENLTGLTSMVEQVAPLQDGVNKRKNQIDKNASIVNGKVVGTGVNGLKVKEFASIDWSNSEDGIFMSNGELGDIQRVSGAPLPQFVENDMNHSIGEIDNLMGTHSTTRGEREGRETATGRQLLREQDRGRIDVIGRRLEEAIGEVFRGWTQLVKVYYTAKKTITVLGKTGQEEFLDFNKNSIDDGMEISVIPGTLIPDDKASRQQRALTLVNSQLISPPDALRELGYKNPEEMAANLFMWQTNPQQLIDKLNQESGSQNEEGAVARQAQQADEENKRMMQGEPVPPFEEADANHISAHERLMEQPQFQELPPEIQQIFIDHVKAEIQIVEGGVKKKL